VTNKNIYNDAEKLAVLGKIKCLRGSGKCSAKNGHLILLLISVQQAKKDENSIFKSKMLRGFSTSHCQ
jgi:hypothetical protein